jgi:glutathione S-transferase
MEISTDDFPWPITTATRTLLKRAATLADVGNAAAFVDSDLARTLTSTVDLGDPASRDAFLAIWPVGRMPVLVDRAANRTIPESSIIIEYLDCHYPGATPLIPSEFDQALETRLQDRFFDLQVSESMQKIVIDRIRPKGQGDRHGVEAAKASLLTAYNLLDRQMATRTWAAGEAFTMADCSAAPALFYADWVVPITHAHVRAYLDRLMNRPSFARVVEEARPYRGLFPRPRTDE